MESDLSNSYTMGLGKKHFTAMKFEEKVPEPFRKMMLAILQLGGITHIGDHLLSMWNSLISERIFGKGWLWRRAAGTGTVSGTGTCDILHMDTEQSVKL